MHMLGEAWNNKQTRISHAAMMTAIYRLKYSSNWMVCGVIDMSPITMYAHRTEFVRKRWAQNKKKLYQKEIHRNFKIIKIKSLRLSFTLYGSQRRIASYTTLNDLWLDHVVTASNGSISESTRKFVHQQTCIRSWRPRVSETRNV